MTSPAVDPALYTQHLAAAQAALEDALGHARAAGLALRGAVLHAGPLRFFHADDVELPFHPTPHFARFAPVAGPGHALLVEPGRRPHLHLLAPRDYWCEPPARPAHPLWDALEVSVHEDSDALQRAIGARSGWAYVGPDPAWAARLEIAPEAIEPRAFLAPLDWHRAYKSGYEQACLREAARIAGLGHAAVRSGVAAGRSERELHAAYLAATGHLEHETPYGNIIAWDEAGAVLHYQTKRQTRPDPGRSFLIDAGGAAWGYASDVTRTYLRAGAPAAWRTLVEGLHALQERLVERVAPGASFVELHADAERGIGELLREVGILRVSLDEALERALVRPFFPHGLGHHLGLQVHDVGGRQVTPAGAIEPPPERWPHLRTTRPLEAGQVITIEPGAYLIPLLLEPHRAAGERAIDWALVDQLLPCGGVRVEDDVLVTAGGRENLTRPHVPATWEP